MVSSAIEAKDIDLIKAMEDSVVNQWNTRWFCQPLKPFASLQAEGELAGTMYVEQVFRLDREAKRIADELSEKLERINSIGIRLSEYDQDILKPCDELFSNLEAVLEKLKALLERSACFPDRIDTLLAVHREEVDELIEREWLSDDFIKPIELLQKPLDELGIRSRSHQQEVDSWLRGLLAGGGTETRGFVVFRSPEKETPAKGGSPIVEPGEPERRGSDLCFAMKDGHYGYLKRIRRLVTYDPKTELQVSKRTFWELADPGGLEQRVKEIHQFNETEGTPQPIKDLANAVGNQSDKLKFRTRAAIIDWACEQGRLAEKRSGVSDSNAGPIGQSLAQAFKLNRGVDRAYSWEYGRRLPDLWSQLVAAVKDDGDNSWLLLATVATDLDAFVKAYCEEADGYWSERVFTGCLALAAGPDVRWSDVSSMAVDEVPVQVIDLMDLAEHEKTLWSEWIKNPDPGGAGKPERRREKLEGWLEGFENLRKSVPLREKIQDRAGKIADAHQKLCEAGDGGPLLLEAMKQRDLQLNPDASDVISDRLEHLAEFIQLGLSDEATKLFQDHWMSTSLRAYKNHLNQYPFSGMQINSGVVDPEKAMKFFKEPDLDKLVEMIWPEVVRLPKNRVFTVLPSGEEATDNKQAQCFVRCVRLAQFFGFCRKSPEFSDMRSHIIIKDCDRYQIRGACQYYSTWRLVASTEEEKYESPILSSSRLPDESPRLSFDVGLDRDGKLPDMRIHLGAVVEGNEKRVDDKVKKSLDILPNPSWINVLAFLTLSENVGSGDGVNFFRTVPGQGPLSAGGGHLPESISEGVPEGRTKLGCIHNMADGNGPPPLPDKLPNIPENAGW